MQLGIFAKTFARSRFEDALDAIVAHGVKCIQFTFACAGLPSLPESIAPKILEQIRRECESRGVSIIGVSGTFNMIHPDLALRAAGFRGLQALAPATRALGCDFISLCTGSRDPHDMWAEHRDNDSPGAWSDLRKSIEAALVIADQHDVLLGIEPETGNVVGDARKARKLLDEVKSRRLKIIIDPANLFRPGPAERMRETIDEAFALLAPDIAMAHAKELGTDGLMGELAPGEGVIDWDYYIAHLRQLKFAGALVLHGCPEFKVTAAVNLLRKMLSRES